MAESKSDHFSFEINAHSEKNAKFDPLSTNRLAVDSECGRTMGLKSVRAPKDARTAYAAASAGSAALTVRRALFLSSDTTYLWTRGCGLASPFAQRDTVDSATSNSVANSLSFPKIISGRIVD
jgi:hypothetical protein